MIGLAIELVAITVGAVIWFFVLMFRLMIWLAAVVIAGVVIVAALVRDGRAKRRPAGSP